MNRYDFMRQLEMLLSDITPGERQEALQFYNDYFDDAGAENEQDVIKALGSPARVAASIKADLNGNAAGEFTETGYKDSFNRNQEIIKYGQPEQGSGDQAAGNQNAADREAGYRNPGGPNGEYRSAGSGGADGGKNPYDNNPYRTGQNQGNPYSSAAYTGNYQNNQNSGNSGSYQNGAYRNTGYSTGNTAGKKGMSGGTLALVILVCILASPVLITVAAAVFGLVIAVIAVVASLFVAVAAVSFALVVVGIALLGAGFSHLLAVPFGSMCLLGGGLVCIAFGILFAIVTVWLCVKAIPAVVRFTVSICRKPFAKKRLSGEADRRYKYE